MKKILLLLAMPLVCMTTLSAQISQEQTDQIVIEHLSNETKPYCIYAKEDVQTNFEVTTATGETLELSYPAWVYYVSYSGETNGKYLIIKESSGNILEANTKNDKAPDDLEGWRTIVDYPTDIPFEEYSLEGTSCQWINLNYDEKVIVINSIEELENYISCTEGSYPEIDFSQYTLLLASGGACLSIDNIAKSIQQLSCNEYELYIEILLNETIVVEEWTIALIMRKLDTESNTKLTVETIIEGENYPIDIPFEDLSGTGTLCYRVAGSFNDGVRIVNSLEEWQNYITCTNDIYPEVDFSIHTLILARGVSITGISKVTRSIQQLSPCKYRLDIELWRSGLQQIVEWGFTLVINKISEESQIELNVTYY